jgi:hypothetical protein
MTQAAIGEKLTVKLLKCNVDPLMIACDAVNANDCRNVPADDAVHNDTCVIVSDVVPVKSDSVFSVIDPPDAAFHVIALRVEAPATLVVPAAPGSAV